MSRQQVRDILGTPLVASLFHADRWDYVFTLKRPGEDVQTRKLVVIFEGEHFVRAEGDRDAHRGRVRCQPGRAHPLPARIPPPASHARTIGALPGTQPARRQQPQLPRLQQQQRAAPPATRRLE